MASTLALKPRLNWWEVSALCHPCNPFNISIRYTVFLFLSSFYSYVFWLGDFNYRINETIENIKGLCGKQEYSALWPHDQVFKYILYIYIVMYSVPLLHCGSSTVIKKVDSSLKNGIENYFRTCLWVVSLFFFQRQQSKWNLRRKSMRSATPTII